MNAPASPPTDPVSTAIEWLEAGQCNKWSDQKWVAGILRSLRNKGASPGEPSGMQTSELVHAAVRLTLEISKAHWVRTGTPIKPEESELVTSDVLGILPRSVPEPSEKQDITPQRLHAAWIRYCMAFGEQPHGSLNQMAALLEFMPPGNQPGALLNEKERDDVGRSQGELAVLKKDGRSYEVRRVAGQALEVITMLAGKFSETKVDNHV